MEACKLELESSPSSLQLEKTPEQQGRPNVAKNKFNKANKKEGTEFSHGGL